MAVNIEDSNVGSVFVVGSIIDQEVTVYTEGTEGYAARIYCTNLSGSSKLAANTITEFDCHGQSITRVSIEKASSGELSIRRISMFHGLNTAPSFATSLPSSLSVTKTHCAESWEYALPSITDPESDTVLSSVTVGAATFISLDNAQDPNKLVISDLSSSSVTVGSHIIDVVLDD